MSTQTNDAKTENTSYEVSSVDSDSASTKQNKSWYRRYLEGRFDCNTKINEDELKKYTGMSKGELERSVQDRRRRDEASGREVGHRTGFGISM